LSLLISTWIFEKVAPEDLPVLTGMTQKPRFYDSKQPPNHTEQKREGRGERGEEKKGLLALIIFIYFGESF